MPTSQPGPPKLRSSCDECGAAKLKCDRDQPRCGRCRSLGVACIYGISRKMGKPPRKRPRMPHEDVQPVEPGHAGIAAEDEEDAGYAVTLSASHRDPGGERSRYHHGDITHAHRDPSGLAHARGLADVLAPDYHEILLGDLFDPLLPDLSALHFEHPACLPSASHDHGLVDADLRPTADGPEDTVPSASDPSHDCFPEAHAILNSLHLQNVLGMEPTPPTPSSVGSIQLGELTVVPLDRVLRLNREAREKLGYLLSCACARAPPLTLLYASILSRILVWYQQAAGMPSSEGSPNTITLTTPDDASMVGSLPWSDMDRARRTSTAGGFLADPSSLLHSSDAGMAVAPSKIVVGTFEVDDQRMQTGLKIQLLAGEMSAVGRLIDQFVAYIFACPDHDAPPGRVAHGLFQSLYAWLKAEHARIAGMLEARLKDVYR